MDTSKLKFFVTVAAESLREAGSIPAGHLYAALMSQGVTLSDYQIVEDCLCKILHVKKDRSHLLTWTIESENLMPQRKKA